jgi:hypothetical protein
MTTEVNEVSPGAVQGGVSTAGQQPQHSEQAAPQPMGNEQQAALQEIGRMRASYSTTPSDQRDALTQKIVELQRYAFGTGPKPTWHGEQKPDPKLSDLSEYDPMAEAFAKGYEPMSTQDAQLVRSNVVLNGLSPQNADAFMDFAQEAQLPAIHARDISRRVAHHLREGGDLALSPDEEREYALVAAGAFGSVERLQEVRAKALAYLQSTPLGKLVQKELPNSSVFWDPRVLLSLSNLHAAKGVK